MASDYQDYLAGQILSEGKIVTYRLLSRMLKVRSNAAKRMLYEFHRLQNAKQAASVHATYLVTGTVVSNPLRPVNDVEDGTEDTPLRSSPHANGSGRAHEPSEENAKQRLVTLTKEEHLKTVKKRFSELSCIHIYSLEPNTIKNLETLSSVAKQIVTEFANEDPLVYNNTYGIIQNPNVKRRTGARPLPVALPTAAPSNPFGGPQAEPIKSGTRKSTPFSFATSKQSIESKDEPATQQRKNGKSQAPLKRDKSDLFRAFAKSQPKLKRENTDGSVTSIPQSRPEAPASQDSADFSLQSVENADCEVLMADASDEDEGGLSEPETKADSTAKRDARLAREAELRKMMEDDDDEPMEDAPVELKQESEEEAKKEEDKSMPRASPEKDSDEEKPAVTVSGGRRRGRRKVMKKKTTKDADGYLVTREEPTWESFSEDEPAPAPKPKFFSSSAGSKSKKGSGKAGGGNIMNFFGKK